MLKGRIVLLANGFADSGETKSTLGLTEWMLSQGILTVAHIGWATKGFPEQHRRANDIAIERMKGVGFLVIDIQPTKSGVESLKKFDAIYLNGGHPATLRWMLKETGADKAIQKFHQEGKPILGASSGGIVLGSGSLFLVSQVAVKPITGVPWMVRQGLIGSGLGLYPEALIPHRAENDSQARLPKCLARLGLFGAKKLIFVADGQIKVID